MQDGAEIHGALFLRWLGEIWNKKRAAQQSKLLKYKIVRGHCLDRHLQEATREGTRTELIGGMSIPTLLLMSVT